MSAGSQEKELDATSTWAVAIVCFILIAISIVIEKLIHHTGSWLKKKRKASLYKALEKIKAELMLLGFLSLLLTIGEDPLSNICVPKKVGDSWHPCRNTDDNDGKYYNPCKEGKVLLISAHGIHQLHIFIFVLAVAHVLYCVVTYGLGKLKMRQWKSWEDETKTVQYQYYNDPGRYKVARDTSFGRRHLHFWSKTPVELWIVCFFRQFFTSVAKVDYLTLRHGFITEHLPPQSQESFNFHKYINRSCEEDFKVIVGISPVIWLCAVLFLLTYTNGWYSHFWLPFLCLVIILLVGTKLQVIITKMGIRILERGDDVEGSPVVQPSDDLFWFRSPHFILSLIHFVLFENAFQLAFFAWSWYTFGYPSCFHENLEDMIIRIATGVLIQLLSSYVTLPLYALVTQMGSKMKQLKQGRLPSASSTPSSNRPTSPLHASMPPDYLQHGHKKSDEEAGYQVSNPRHHDAVDFDRNDQLPEASVIEIEKDFGELHPEFTKEQTTLAASNSAQSF